MMNWTETENEIFSNCKHEKCSHTEPTAFNPEVILFYQTVSVEVFVNSA
jgi:hypothetical protein